MNHTAPAAALKSKERRARALYVAVTVFLSLCVVANMVLIFQMSAESPTESGDRSDGVTDVVVDVVYPDLEQRPPAEQQNIFTSMHHIVRKLAHFSEFALLGFLTTLLVMHLSRRLVFLRAWLRLCLPALFCLLYAISDEVHQIFTRHGPAVKDVLIDFGGAVAGMLVARFLCWGVWRIARAVGTRLAARSKRKAATA